MENPEQPQYQPQPQPVQPPQPEPQPQPEYQAQQQNYQAQPLPPVQEPVQPQYTPETPSPQVTDPGKTLGVVGFVFAFIGLQLIGLILSIIGFRKSKKAGFKNSLAVAGIILNSVFLFVAIVIGFFAVITIVSYNGISDRANASASQSSAASVVKWAELYSSDNGTYPQSYADIATQSPTIIASDTPLVFEPSSAYVIAFYKCGSEGNKIGYWDYTLKQEAYRYAGTATSSSNCTFVES